MTKRPTKIPLNPLGGEFRALGASLNMDEAGERADAFLSRVYPFLSRAQWQKRMAEGKLLISGRRVRTSYKLKGGDFFSFYHPHQHEPEVDRDLYPIWKQGQVMAIY